ncbi:beta-glucosidase [Aspergillus tubingensis]
MAMADIDNILSRLTIDEKISLVSGTDFWHTASVPRLGISAIRVSDGPNGVRGTKFFNEKPAACYPCGTAIGATWNTALVESLRQLQGQEAIAKGINRVPGRIFGTGYSHLLAALFPSATLGGYANSLFWVILMIVPGDFTTHAYLNDFYRPWLFWIDLMRYFFGASLGSVLHGVAVECFSSDLVVFDAPPGRPCGQYTVAKE